LHEIKLHVFVTVKYEKFYCPIARNDFSIFTLLIDKCHLMLCSLLFKGFLCKLGLYCHNTGAVGCYSRCWHNVVIPSLFSDSAYTEI